MQRRAFIKTSAYTAIAVSAFGFIHFDGKKYVGDCETTTDILGPFYRPGSPERNNLVIEGEPGKLVELSGMIMHNDCTTPYANAKIELWHCDHKGVYDNSSGAYRYRGTSFSDAKGNYDFHTILPVPYNVGNGQIRPAHFHLMITAEGYQPLVTQLYFTGDSYISKDPYAASPKAKSRILDIQKLSNGSEKVVFNVSMAEVLPVEMATLDKLVGTYTDVASSYNKLNLFKFDKALWVKNEAFGNKFEYAGNNTFSYGGLPADMMWSLHFELMANDAIQLTISADEGKGKHTTVFMKSN